MRDPVVREFLLSFWKIHILHHAGGDGVYGQWMLDELRRHGYALSPGTLYPVLTRMTRRGWLRSAEPESVKAPRVYRLTPAGARVLSRLRVALDELHGEIAGARTQRRTRRAEGRRRRSSSGRS